MPEISHNMPVTERKFRLIAAAMTSWARGTLNGSARYIADFAGMNASAINYHFGSLEHLYFSAAEEACRRTGDWCRHVGDRIAAVPKLPPHALGGLLATIIDDWCVGQRPLALAWRYAQLTAARDPALASLCASWQMTWDDFWQRIDGLTDMGDRAGLMGIFFDAESFQHLIDWDRIVDRAALQELCELFAARLTGARPPAAFWRSYAKSKVEPVSVPALDGKAGDIARAALATLGREGSAGLTHRAVAARANVSVGAVSHHFKTAADLLNAAYLALVSLRTAQGKLLFDQDRPLTRGDYIPILVEFATSDRLDEESRAIDELRLMSGGNPVLLPIAQRMRYERGYSSQSFLTRAPEFAGKITALDGALLSTWIQGFRRSGPSLAVGQRRARAQDAISRYFDLLATAPLAQPAL
ncbi:hypothetical protein BH10PSE13_BH10PSE13_22200 [soil metagenome]